MELLLQFLGYSVLGLGILGFVTSKKNGREIAPESKAKYREGRTNLGGYIGGYIGGCVGAGIDEILRIFRSRNN